MGVRFALTAALLLTACKETGVLPNLSDASSAERGKAAAQALGCGACHDIPGIWPSGRTGPSLADFSGRGVVGGGIPNRPDALAAFLLDPSGSAMPHVPMTPAQAADIAAFVHQIDAR